MKSLEITTIIRGKLYGNPDNIINNFIIDSRLLTYDSDVAFVAIVGQNHDGHSFIPALLKKGIRSFIVKRLPREKVDYPNASFIVVNNTVAALQELARHNRMLFKSPVIGITGSTGKTVVKEWLADVISLSRQVIRSPKSYNSQIGVPLSLLKLDNKYGVAIIEAGISMPGEMAKLEHMVEPDIGVLTNIGDAHAGNFENNRQKTIEKLNLFTNSLMLVYCSDYKVIDEEVKRVFPSNSKVIVDWSMQNREATLYVDCVTTTDEKTNLSVQFRGEFFVFTIPFTDKASIENAITTAAVCLSMNIPIATIKQGLAALSSVAMRMEIKDGINNCRLICDFYNSDPGSFSLALDSLKGNDKNRTKTLILSDFVQSGRDEQSMYKDVSQLVTRAGIDKFIGIGHALSSNRHLLGGNSKFYETTDDFLKQVDISSFKNEVILLKGARQYEFEKIGNILEQQVYQTILEVNLDAVANNLNEFRKLLSPSTRVMVMVKAFAYGAGAAEIAGFLEYHGVSYLGVANVDEGAELRNTGISLPVIVMNPDPATLEVLVRYNLEPVIYGFDSYRQFVKVAERHGLVHYPIHVEIDSGMHRLGFLPSEVPAIATMLASNETVKVASVFSHFAASEDPLMDSFTNQQAQLFTEAVDIITGSIGYQVIRHICNSAGTARFPRYHFDMVRPGIGIYGAGDYENCEMRVVGRFKTKISQIKRIAAGEPVGYNCRDVADVDRDIAVLPVGYADGLNRKLGNRHGEVFIRGKRVPLVGNICMDACMVDVSGIGAQSGDEVEIFGENIKIDELANICGTIPYEILTSIPHRVKRVFYRD